MKKELPLVIDKIVNNDLCTGCGICVSFCENKALKMEWNEYGFLVPNQIGECDNDQSCISVCPFNPNPEPEVKTETEIADFVFEDTPTTKRLKKIGKYENTYVGYSKKHRETSSSGGIATYVSKELLKRGIVKHVLNVKSIENRFEYVITSDENTLLSTAKTRYFPVTMEKVFSEIEKLEGNVAIVGIPCFLKGVRLAQYKNKALNEKIVFTIGIICGGVKSKFFTEYLIQKAGLPHTSDEIEQTEYRIKDFESSAGDYSFGIKIKGSNETQSVKMKGLGDMWGTGLFKSNACDFCDDVSAELADISLGDAWIKPFVDEGAGNNVIVTRSNIAERIIQEGILNGELKIEQIKEEEFIKSQKGSYRHRQEALNFRLKTSKISELPPKRDYSNKLSFEVKLIQKLRMKTRKQSLLIWKKEKNSEEFDKKMAPLLSKLKRVTKLGHYKREIIDRVKVKLRFK
ncbi:Coenzyme F420 hydrogenase/dehydrogenase, beta subunit C-terminal domain [Tamlana sp. 62-3]|uniref:Coenzyme F420 hydrogenase/dehydrogenase, beta subunit C-terminal domain n=1 Tax=Neotamlana sargassicola TaxID=2883125 RepID=A0A9X1I9D4_9FLAO|nr:Coenzyme F420 hydrogenase/dehydrogenase, beta subunit C-terminal domain [Tamlana sargassicola]MCB4809219.1 Coenzyme F420 hydrogenase/dehydrogenase, beta subunit C-terminal domain [Tamlana sargassicola]